MSELKAPRKTGKWLRDNVPHSGWQCLEVRDEGTRCEMCEVQTITYNHVMVHELLPGIALDCGCVCAAYMTGNAEQERLREALYKWRLDHRRERTPVEKLRRKGWHGTHYTSGEHSWTLHDDGRKYYGPGFVVRVKDRDGWRYSVRREWWDWRDETKHVHGGPFASDVEAATAGIERAELLAADPQWMEADREAEAVHEAAAKVAREEKFLRDSMRLLVDGGHPDLAAALEQGSIKTFDAFQEMRRRRNTEEAARKQTAD
jgi:hypothetical protein